MRENERRKNENNISAGQQWCAAAIGTFFIGVGVGSFSWAGKVCSARKKVVKVVVICRKCRKEITKMRSFVRIVEKNYDGLKEEKTMKISYNSKVVLAFVFAAIVVRIVGYLVPSFIESFFVLRANMSFANPLDYFRLFSYTLGHSNLEHLSGNLIFLLLLGPLLEEKYGHLRLLFMILATALVTASMNLVFFHDNILGASGIVFMLIILSSIVGKNDGSIPIEFLIVACIFLGREVIPMFKADNISQMAHILGGGCGAVFGFVITKSKINKKEV